MHRRWCAPTGTRAAIRAEDRLIAFYAAYRALVRAKVALLRAAQHPTSISEHGSDSAAARDGLALAEQFAWRARLPLVIVLCGVPAAGKSHLAQALAEVSHLPHLSCDVTRKRLAGIRPQQRARSELYSPEFNRLTYAELGRRAARETAVGGGALVDATFRHRADRDVFADAFAGAAPLLFVECRAPARVLAERAPARCSRSEQRGVMASPVVSRMRRCRSSSARARPGSRWTSYLLKRT